LVAEELSGDVSGDAARAGESVDPVDDDPLRPVDRCPFAQHVR
jgi:hypothetical protein